MAQQSQNRLQHFNLLKSKYKANNYQDSSPSSLLYLILRKVELAIKISDLEFDWLQESELLETIEIIQIQQYSLGEAKRLEAEFSHLKSKYKVAKPWEYSVDSFLYFILWKLESGSNLNNSELELLQENNLNQTVALVKDISNFLDLKKKYQATKSQDSYPDSRLYKILQKIDTAASLSDSEYEWLLNYELFETIEIYEKQESAKQAEFNQLKVKYQVNKQIDTNLASTLYQILKKIEADIKLNHEDNYWLEKQGLTETIRIVEEIEQKREFATLKVKYEATQHQDISPNSYLYSLLKRLEIENYISEDDFSFLRQLKLLQTLEIANKKYADHLKSKIELENLLSEAEIEWLKENKREDIITLAQQKHFAILKRKYGLIDPVLPMQPFYEIMLKLEKKERLDILLVTQLIERNMLSRDGKIAIKHYRLEAEFYEQEIKRTGNKNKIPTASSYWRKANEPKQALKLTNIDLNQIKDIQIKSAILVTRGAAFRDINDLYEAENCARKAVAFQPDGYQPYTLMGAICYDKHDYEEGDKWFEQAIQLGAETEDIDAELKRVFRNTKNEEQRHEAATYLLKKDPHRYAWAKSYLKTPKNDE